MLHHLDAPQIQVVQMAQPDQSAILQGKVIKQQAGGNVSYELRMARKVRFAGPQCPYPFTQNWVPILSYASNERYLALSGVHRYRVQLSCAMEGPSIERMQLQK
ncbi:hypothetical protein HMI48_00395 [Acidithiobacillus ferrooxidans]|uniref:hypothetical protein n=1 Tax=Acidithiobacillus ferrooxidans TaxID=920 RepID=UPI001C074A88|nr:hypothetical protein [Acidithiobacillus ferrooxidans]MBU2772435.1 hypothetical protein [Acidithiobacillus ferrooxidans]